MKKPSIYIETSVVSYLIAEPSINIVTAARQALTRQWLDEKRHDYKLHISEFVVSEAASGDPLMANRGLAALSGIAEIQLTGAATDRAEMLIEEGPLPAKAALDALHIAVAIAGGMEFFGDLELQASGQRNDAWSNRAKMPFERVRTTHYLYPRGTLGSMTMHQDEIIEEVRANRDRLAAQRNYDIRALYEDAKNCEHASDRKVVKLAPRRLSSTDGQGDGSSETPAEK